MSRILIPKGTGQRGDSIGKDYNEIRPEDSADERAAKLEAWIAKRVGEHIAGKLPDREWKIVVDLKNQMLIVACDSISNNKGWHIKMAGRTIHDLQVKGLYAASEILERHNLARTKRFDADVIETLERDAKDDVITPDSDPEPI
jgi:hypothetical protein